MSRLKRGLEFWKKFGFKVFFLRGISKYYQSFYLLKIEITSSNGKEEFNNIYEINEKLLGKLLEEHGETLSSEKIQILKKRLERPSTTGFLYEKEGHIYGMHWVDTESFVEFQSLEKTLPENSIYLYDTFIFPEYRRKGVSEILHDFTFYTFQKDFQKAFNFVASYNQPMLSLMKKMNFKKTGVYCVNKINNKEQLKEYDDEKEIR